MHLNTLLVSISLFASTLTYAHARLKPGSATPPRNDSTGLKTAECGGAAVPRGTNPKVYKPGEEITVQWEETINHPGYYVIRFSAANDTDFDKHVLVEKFVDTQNTAIDSPAAYHQYSAKVKLPNVTCEACTLQLIQVMEEDPAKPTFYYSCSDIKLTADKGATPAAQKPAKPSGVSVEREK